MTYERRRRGELVLELNRALLLDLLPEQGTGRLTVQGEVRDVTWFTGTLEVRVQGQSRR